MKLVQTLLVRDEADVVDAQIAYHLGAGVDFVIATDHESTDGTTEILEGYARDGVLRRLPVTGEMRESAWRTAMARLAATEYGADWVINTDADEFWMPRGGALKDVLAAIPESYGIIWALSRQFVPRPGTGWFAERMIARVRAPAPINDPTSPYRPHAKVAHRGSPEIRVRYGAHHVGSARLQPLRDWYPVDCLHFPFRSPGQYARKCTRRGAELGQYARGTLASEQGDVEGAYRELVVTDEALEAGVAAGFLAIDTRLRNALRDMRAGVTPRPAPTPADDDVVADAAALREADVVRLQRSADTLVVRLDELEHRGAERRVVSR